MIVTGRYGCEVCGTGGLAEVGLTPTSADHHRGPSHPPPTTTLAPTASRLGLLALAHHLASSTYPFISTPMPAQATRASALRLLSLTHHHGCRGCGSTHSAAHHHHHHHPHTHGAGHQHASNRAIGLRGMASPVDVPIFGGPPPGKGDFAFEVSPLPLMCQLSLSP